MNKSVATGGSFFRAFFYSEAFAMFVAVVIAGMVVWGYMTWSNKATSTTIAGDLVAVNFSGDATVVTTTVGAFRVAGSFQAFNGNALVIHAYNNAPSQLCDERTGFCRPLLN